MGRDARDGKPVSVHTQQLDSGEQADNPVYEDRREARDGSMGGASDVTNEGPPALDAGVRDLPKAPTKPAARKNAAQPKKPAGAARKPAGAAKKPAGAAKRPAGAA